MYLLKFILALLPLVFCSPLDQYRLPLTSTTRCTSPCDPENAPLLPQRIAIIGSGIVGASAAYTLSENARANSKAPPISITIFEQNPIIGGRITTTKVFDEEELTIDTCAATFSAGQDTCVLRLARETGLMATSVLGLDNGTAVWNGEEIVGLIEDTGFRGVDLASNFKQARFRARYGETPFEAGRRMTLLSYSTSGISLFKSLDLAVSGSGLNESLVRGACEGGRVLCNDQPQSEVYLREVIEAGVRDRFFGDYDELNELNSVLGLSEETNLLSVDGGNLRLIDRLIKISNAELKLNNRVRRLQHRNDGKWNVISNVVEIFDKVIIATPLSLTDLGSFPGISDLPKLQFADTVVTHFTTKWNLNATYFGTGLPVPQNILTSATATKSGNRAEVPFFSFRLLDNFIQPVNLTGRPDAVQKLYKIVSTQNISLAEITQYLEPRDLSDAREPAVTWMHREYLPKSVPRLDRTVKIQGDIEISPGLFYAGGGAQVTDTIEFGCRMGTNAANLIIRAPVRPRPGNG